MRIIETKVFKFSELSESAKQKALDSMRNSDYVCYDNYYYDYIFDDYSTIAGLFGLDINTKPVQLMNRSTRYEPSIYFDTERNRFLSFAGSYGYKRGSIKALQGYAPKDNELARIFKTLQDIQRKNFYSIVGNFAHGRSRIACSFYRNDDKPLSEEYESDLIQLFEDFADCILKAIESDIEYRYSDEYIIETIEANEYEFLENGAIS